MQSGENMTEAGQSSLRGPSFSCGHILFNAEVELREDA